MKKLSEERKLISFSSSEILNFTLIIPNLLHYWIFLSAENLDELEEIVVPIFMKIVNKHLTNIKYLFINHPWGTEQLKFKIHIVPLTDDVHFVRLNFPVPDVQNQYRTSVSIYFLCKHQRRSKYTSDWSWILLVAWVIH